MLYVVTKTNEYSIHIGEKISGDPEDLNINYIQADGDELTTIYNNFPNIMKANCRVVTFVGETARFIVCNWDGLSVNRQ
jgi:hypothetical protein